MFAATGKPSRATPGGLHVSHVEPRRKSCTPGNRMYWRAASQHRLFSEGTMGLFMVPYSVVSFAGACHWPVEETRICPVASR